MLNTIARFSSPTMTRHAVSAPLSVRMRSRAKSQAYANAAASSLSSTECSSRPLSAPVFSFEGVFLPSQRPQSVTVGAILCNDMATSLFGTPRRWVSNR